MLHARHRARIRPRPPKGGTPFIRSCRSTVPRCAHSRRTSGCVFASTPKPRSTPRRHRRAAGGAPSCRSSARAPTSCSCTSVRRSTASPTSSARSRSRLFDLRRPGLLLPQRHGSGPLPRQRAAREAKPSARGGTVGDEALSRGHGRARRDRAREPARAAPPLPAAAGRHAVRLLLPDVEAARRRPELVRAPARGAQPPDDGPRHDRPRLRGPRRPGHHRRDRLRRLGMGRHPLRRRPARVQEDRHRHALRRSERAVRRVRRVLRREGERREGMAGRSARISGIEVIPKRASASRGICAFLVSRGDADNSPRARGTALEVECSRRRTLLSIHDFKVFEWSGGEIFPAEEFPALRAVVRVSARNNTFPCPRAPPCMGERPEDVS